MSRLVISPPDYPEIIGPLVFLAGPIQGAPLWQAEASRLLGEGNPELHVANPRREYASRVFDYAAQVDWETHHLRFAATRGLILFWLAREIEPILGRTYAQTTRFELAEWKVRHERDGVKLVIGIESGFSGAKYIRHRFTQDCSGVPLCDSLEETCRTVIELLGTSTGQV
jgi:hypothetical protein